MKIGITCYPTYGGSGVVATELGKCLAKKGHDIHFISYQVPFRLVNEFNDRIFFHEVDVSSYPLFQYPPYSLSLASQMAAVVQAEQLDILHVHYAIPHATCAFLARQLLPGNPVKIITTLHGTDITVVGKDPSFYPLTKFSIEQSDGITGVSDYLVKKTCREFKIKRHIEMIPNFVDIQHFKKKKKCCGCGRIAPAGDKIVTHISNFRPVKRISDVVKTFAGIRAKLPAKLLMVGDGPERACAAALAAKLGIGDDVTFLGKQENVTDILSSTDLFLFPSEEESFGLAALEAMACNVPVVGARAGGLPEVVEHGKDGYLCKVGDVKAMTAASLRILRHPDRQKAFGNYGRGKAETAFNCSRIVNRYEAYYRRVMEPKTRR